MFQKILQAGAAVAMLAMPFGAVAQAQGVYTTPGPYGKAKPGVPGYANPGPYREGYQAFRNRHNFEGRSVYRYHHHYVRPGYRYHHRYIRHYEGRSAYVGHRGYCIKLCAQDMNPCDPIQYKRADGRCAINHWR
jgi:hypothetical protein